MLRERLMATGWVFDRKVLRAEIRDWKRILKDRTERYEGVCNEMIDQVQNRAHSEILRAIMDRLEHAEQQMYQAQEELDWCRQRLWETAGDSD